MSESTRDQRMTPGLAPVAVVDLTVPRATEGGKSAKQGQAIEDKGKGKAEEGQDTYGEGGSSGRGGGGGSWMENGEIDSVGRDRIGRWCC